MLLLLGMGFFMGVFIASYQISSETLFIDLLSKEYLDKAFFIAGFSGIVATALFVFFQKRIKFSLLAIGSVALIALFTITARLFNDSPIWTELIPGVNVLVFALFVMIAPITAILLLSFWGVFGRVFDLRQSRRIIGGIDTGQLMATIITFFSIGFIPKDLVNDTTDLLMISSVASVGMLLFTFLVVRSYDLNSVDKAKSKSNEGIKEVGYKDIVKSKFLGLLSLFLIVSMIASKFIDYNFINATDTWYPDENDLRKFLSFFNGTIMIFSFLIQSLVNDFIINNYGLRVALMVMPLILALFTIGAIISGHIYGYEERTDLFIFFFLFSAIGKLSTASLKDALENPAFKLFFLPLDVKIRFDVQTKIEGVINQFAILVAGAMQIGLGLLTYFKLIHYSYFVIAVAGLVVWLAHKLYAEYKLTLRRTLEQKKKSIDVIKDSGRHNALDVLSSNLKDDNAVKVLSNLKILERLDLIQFEFELLEYLNSSNVAIRKFCYEKIAEHMFFSGFNIVKRKASFEKEEEVAGAARIAMNELKLAVNHRADDATIKKLIRSTDYKKRVLVSRLILNNYAEKFKPYVLELLRDINPVVRLSAFYVAGKLNDQDLWQVAIDNLDSPSYANAATSALIASGDQCYFSVDSDFYKTNKDSSTLVRIIQIISRIRGREAAALLWKKMDYPDKQIISEIYNGLSYLNFKANDMQASRIKIGIEADLANITWNIKALLEIPNDDHFDKMIRDALEEENELNFENIFRLMSMIYDAKSISLIRENINSGLSENITFAVEMLNIFVDEDLKPKLFPALDDLKPEEKLTKLHDHFPPEEFSSYTDLLLQIINRDYNAINKWTKALAMYKLFVMRSEVTDDLIANLFNPDPILRQTAAAIIYRLNPEAYKENSLRLEGDIKYNLDKTILPPSFMAEGDKFHQKLLHIEKIILLKEINHFKQLSGEVLLKLVENIDEVKIPEGVDFIRKWDDGDVPFFILISGRAIMRDGDKEIGILKERDVIGHTRILRSEIFDFSVTTVVDSIFLMLRKEDFFDIMSKNIALVNTMAGILESESELSRNEMDESVYAT